MTEKQRKDLMVLWNKLTGDIHIADKGIASAKIEGERRLYEQKLRDTLAERTGVEAAILTLGWIIIRDKNEFATDIETMSGPRGRRTGTA